VLIAAIAEVAMRSVTLLNLRYCYICGARIWWFCSDCCWSLNTYRGW